MMKEITKAIHERSDLKLLTKFYYRDQQMRFQILLVHPDGSEQVYAEFSDYKIYKDSYGALAAQLKHSNSISFLKKNTEKNTAVPA